MGKVRGEWGLNGDCDANMGHGYGLWGSVGGVGKPLAVLAKKGDLGRGPREAWAAAAAAAAAGSRGGGTGKWVKAELADEAKDEADDGVMDKVEATGIRTAAWWAARGPKGLEGDVLVELKSM